jgi:hypothetical protein
VAALLGRDRHQRGYLEHHEPAVSLPGQPADDTGLEAGRDNRIGDSAGLKFARSRVTGWEAATTSPNADLGSASRART